VLLLSFDPSLGDSRHLLLENKGFDVTAIFGGTKLPNLPKRPDVDAVVVGHEVPHSEYGALIRTIRERIPKAKIIALETVPSQNVGLADYRVNAHAPDKWLKLVVDAVLGTKGRAE
jgi:DNA-binding response OmpR family regulator